MAGLGITIEIDMGRVDIMLDHAIAGAQDLRKPMGEIAGEWLQAVHDRFDAEVDPLGVPWAPRRGNVDPGRKLLVKMGYLHNAVVQDFGQDFAQVGVLKTAGPAIYARIHNEGGTIKHPGGTAFDAPTGSRAKFITNLHASVSHRRTGAHDIVMPKRQFVGEGPKEQEIVSDVLGEFVAGLFMQGTGTWQGAGT